MSGFIKQISKLTFPHMRSMSMGRGSILTPTEFKILMTLAEKPGRVYSRLQLMNIAMGEAFVNYERSIDTHVSNLRRKLSELRSSASIQTVYGIGYRFGVET